MVGASDAMGAAPTPCMRPPRSAGLPRMPELPGSDSPNARPNLRRFKVRQHWPSSWAHAGRGEGLSDVMRFTSSKFTWPWQQLQLRTLVK
jgi:hypothetical protein